MRKPAITAHPHFCPSPNFRLVKRISESDDITESVFLSLRDDGLRVHFLGTFIWRRRKKRNRNKQKLARLIEIIISLNISTAGVNQTYISFNENHQCLYIFFDKFLFV